jgi:hypothetical protein
MMGWRGSKKEQRVVGRERKTGRRRRRGSVERRASRRRWLEKIVRRVGEFCGIGWLAFVES